MSQLCGKDAATAFCQRQQTRLKRMVDVGFSDNLEIMPKDKNELAMTDNSQSMRDSKPLEEKPFIRPFCIFLVFHNFPGERNNYQIQPLDEKNFCIPQQLPQTGSFVAWFNKLLQSR